MKSIILTHPAAKDLYALPLEVGEMILDGLHEYAIGGVGDIVKLVNRSYYRLRVGRYRVIFAEDALTVLAVYIGKRETVTYRRH